MHYKINSTNNGTYIFIKSEFGTSSTMLDAGEFICDGVYVLAMHHIGYP